jgi:hypothetical protein
MKLVISLIILAVGAVSLCVFGLARAGTTNTTPGSLMVQKLTVRSTNAGLLPGNGHQKLPPVVALQGGKLVMQAPKIKPLDKNSVALLSLLPKGTLSPGPGVYNTAPYAGIVVVPDKHPDDRALINLADGDFKTPIIKPDLQFIPRNAPKK